MKLPEQEIALQKEATLQSYFNRHLFKNPEFSV
jgi:hypothetical protein